MRIALFGINYWPEPCGIGPFTAELAEYLLAMGHELHVLTGQPHYPRWTVPERKLPNHEHVNGVHVYRHWHSIPSVQSAIQRAFYEATFLTAASKLLSLPRPDAVVGIVPSLTGGILARLASKRFGVPYSVLFQDLVGRGVVQSGIQGGGRFYALVRALEGWAARGASSIGIVSEGFRSYLLELGVADSRIFRVRNWPRFAEPAWEPHKIRELLGWPRDKFIVLHGGSIGLKQGLENLIEGATLAAGQSTRLRFMFAGDGNQRAKMEHMANARGLSNVEFLGVLSDEDYANALHAADVLVLTQAPSVTDMSLPSRIASYAAAGRPIIAAVSPESDAAKELIELDAALLVQPGDPVALLEAVERLEADPQLRMNLARQAKLCADGLLKRDWALAGLAAVLLPPQPCGASRVVTGAQ